MEFPDLGKRCTYNGCGQLDFLPYTCYHCKKIFCQEHFKLDDHHCPSLEDPTLDVRVPTCPICEKPVPGPRGEDPNIRVNRHIQNNCADPTSKSPGNICHLRGCKAKLLVPIQCPDCGQSYCVKHRLGADHQCQGRPAAPAVSKAPHQLAGLAAIRRAAKNGMRHNQSNTTSKMESERQRLKESQTSAQRKQAITRLQAKASAGRLTENEQIQLATLMSLEEGRKDKCTIS